MTQLPQDTARALARSLGAANDAAQPRPLLLFAIQALNAVKAWRDCEGNDPFPHSVRDLVEAALMAWELREQPSPQLRAVLAAIDPIAAEAAEYGRLKPYLCKTCGGFGLVSHHAQDGSYDDSPCPDCAEPSPQATRALAIADAQMFVALESYGIPRGQKPCVIYDLANEGQCEVRALVDACEELREAVEWLRERDYVEIGSDAKGEFVIVLRRVGDA